MVDVEITRTGQSEDYLLWRFMPVKQANIIDDYTRLLVGEAGRQFTDAGLLGVLIGAEGRIRAANPAFRLRATGRHGGGIDRKGGWSGTGGSESGGQGGG